MAKNAYIKTAELQAITNSYLFSILPSQHIFLLLLSLISWLLEWNDFSIFFFFFLLHSSLTAHQLTAMPYLDQTFYAITPFHVIFVMYRRHVQKILIFFVYTFFLSLLFFDKIHFTFDLFSFLIFIYLPILFSQIIYPSYYDKLYTAARPLQLGGFEECRIWPMVIAHLFTLYPTYG